MEFECERWEMVRLCWNDLEMKNEQAIYRPSNTTTTLQRQGGVEGVQPCLSMPSRSFMHESLVHTLLDTFNAKLAPFQRHIVFLQP